MHLKFFSELCIIHRHKQRFILHNPLHTIIPVISFALTQRLAMHHASHHSRISLHKQNNPRISNISRSTRIVDRSIVRYQSRASIDSATTEPLLRQKQRTEKARFRKAKPFHKEVYSQYSLQPIRAATISELKALEFNQHHDPSNGATCIIYINYTYQRICFLPG